MDFQTIQLTLGIALALGYGGYKVAAARGIRLDLPGLPSRSPRSRLAPPRKLLAPSRLRFERVTLDATDADLLFFIRQSAVLRRLGFQTIGDFTHQALPGAYHRAFVHPEQGFYALLIHRPGKIPPFVELHSFFQDGSCLTLTDAEERDHPRRPALLRLQRLIGLTLDELYSHHLANTEALRARISPTLEVSRHAFFKQYQGMLAIEAAITRTRKPLAGQALSRVLDTLPDIDVAPFLKRHAPSNKAPSETPPEPETPAKPRGLGGSLLSRRRAAAGTPETPELIDFDVIDLDAIAPEPEAPVILDLDVAPPPPEIPPAPVIDLDEPIDPPPPEPPAPLSWEASVTLSEAERRVEAFDETPDDGPHEPPVVKVAARLPWEDAAVPDPATSETSPAMEAPVATLPAEIRKVDGKPVCPHCGATVLSKLSSRCNKCKLPLR